MMNGGIIAVVINANCKLKNRYMHVDYVKYNDSQNIKSKVPKYQYDTLDCNLEEFAVFELVANNPTIKQQEIVEDIRKSIATIK